MNVGMLIRVITVEFSGSWGFRSIGMNVGVVFFEILYDPFSYKMRRDIVGDDREFRGVPDGIDDAMSNGCGDSGGKDNMKTEDISVLIPELFF